MPDTADILRRLGRGDSIEMVCQATGLSSDEFHSWWRKETVARAGLPSGTRSSPAVTHEIQIERDEWGIPHIYATNDTDLFFGFGTAMVQDRLFQLDYLRRRAAGRLSEVLGRDGLELDAVARTIGFPRIAAAEVAAMPTETRALAEAFSSGVNAVIEDSRDNLPIEFSLLDYEPEPWSPVDSAAIAVEFRHYLTVRFPVIVGPDLARRALGDGPLYRAFMQGEADEESILHPGDYAPAEAGRSVPASAAVSDPGEGQGSNNWVLSGKKTTTGKPIVASDPHIAFAAVSCWYEAHLCGGSFNVTGMAYAGMPAIMFGRNEQVAWGITNNACSQRDLYQEKTDSAHPGAFLYDGNWEQAREAVEKIKVRGGDTVSKTIRFSRNGPIVDEILPPAARETGPIALKWLGSGPCGWLTALLDMNRSRSIEQLQESTRVWRVPTFSLVFADSEGHIGYRAVGGIPIRNVEERGYRPGWDPDHQWQGLIPFEDMPHVADPERGWIATANNRPAPGDFPFPLSGVWSSGHRARRVRQMIESTPKLSRDDVARMHQDAKSLRAAECVPGLVATLKGGDDPRLQQAAEMLEQWDCIMAPDSGAAVIFEVFFSHWMRRVVSERFEGDVAQQLSAACAGLASALVQGRDEAGWFESDRRKVAIRETMNVALGDVTSRLGPDLFSWKWGNIHKIELRHILSGRGDLGKLLDRGGLPVRGSGVTVCNTGFDPNWGAPMGANYRLIADMSTTPAGLWAVDAQGESGHPGAEHYCDQLSEWISGRYHFLALGSEEASGDGQAALVIKPNDAGRNES